MDVPGTVPDAGYFPSYFETAPGIVQGDQDFLLKSDVSLFYSVMMPGTPCRKPSAFFKGL